MIFYYSQDIFQANQAKYDNKLWNYTYSIFYSKKNLIEPSTVPSTKKNSGRGWGEGYKDEDAISVFAGLHRDKQPLRHRVLRPEADTGQTSRGR